MPGLPRTFVVRIAFGLATAVTFMALALFTGPASAADLAQPFRAPAPSVPLTFSWTGFYIGGDVGYARGYDSTAEYLTVGNIFTGFYPHYDINGGLGGLYAGYNYQFGMALLGIESDIELANLNGGFVDQGVGGAGTTHLDWQGSLRGRLGFTVDRVLFYGTGGLAFADVNHLYTNLLTGVAENNAGFRTGWTAGAGIEVAVLPNLLARIEYRYTDYGPYNFNSLTAFPGFSGVQEPRFSALRIGAAYKF